MRCAVEKHVLAWWLSWLHIVTVAVLSGHGIQDNRLYGDMQTLCEFENTLLLLGNIGRDEPRIEGLVSL